MSSPASASAASAVHASSSASSFLAGESAAPAPSDYAASVPAKELGDRRIISFIFSWRGVAAATLTGLLGGYAVVALQDGGLTGDPFSCPPPRRPRSAVDFETAPFSPPALLAEARRQMAAAATAAGSQADATAGAASSAAKRALQECAEWPGQLGRPSGGATVLRKGGLGGGVGATSGDVRAQLECRVVLQEDFGEVSTAAVTASVSVQSLRLLDQARSLLQRCTDVTRDLQSARRAGTPTRSPATVLRSLSMLAGLDGASADVLASLGSSHRLLASDGSLPNVAGDTIVGGVDDHDSHEEDEDVEIDADGERVFVEQPLAVIRTDLRGCLLRAVREARAVSAALPSSSYHVQRATVCTPDMLSGIESMVLEEAGAEADPGVQFSFGMHQSEVALAFADPERALSSAPIPLFGVEPPPAARPDAWSVDTAGHRVPSIVAIAEDLLLQAERASVGDALKDRALLRARRLAQHAEAVLAPLGLHEAVASRMRVAAGIFAAFGDASQAARALSDLAQHHLTSGDHQASLIAAGEALTFVPDDALALYLQATLRRGLGELRTDEDVQSALVQLDQASNGLPWDLEIQRATAYSEIAGWGAVAAAGDMATCIQLHDVAHVLICVLCRMVY
eukprot:TRINITY_DN54841_c0_g1_i1.p1 TRINITY_DN54841_c0_g1~~TRINITY_DN54841_c0_g1_i1.p1  ORF type:complete len:626 (+),score=124.83 TRINITY_DN54841_c0_g1_i1:134-2011(+)